MQYDDSIIEAAEEFYSNLCENENSRNRSWEHCYNCFYNARKKENDKDCLDYLSLQLGFYLASWGMLRGTSFLLDVDYKIHKPVVEEILKPKYDCLLDLSYKNMLEVLPRIKELYDNMEEYYISVRKKILKKANVKSGISPILLTKILLGTLGCVPAYDVCFVEGLGVLEANNKSFSERSLIELAELYEKKHEVLDDTRNKFKAYNYIYPQMKLLDMALWQIGKRVIDKKKEENKKNVN